VTEYYVVYDTKSGADAYRGQGPVGAAAVQSLQEGLAALVIPEAAFTSHPLDLAAIKESYGEAIDIAADSVRSRFITNTPGQMATYIEKEAEARRVLADADTPTIFLACEAAALGMDVVDLAREVVAQADQWRQVGARIEATRRKAKTDLAGATHLGAIAVAIRIDWQSAIAPPAEAA